MIGSKNYKIASVIKFQNPYRIFVQNHERREDAKLVVNKRHEITSLHEYHTNTNT